MGTLFVVATPIGNLEDVSSRAARVLGEVDVIAAEDTRRTGRLLEHLGTRAKMVSYHAHNERARRDRLLEALAGGDVALVSDAGTPGISDPGRALVAAAWEAGHVVTPVPGASAVTAAVAATGLVEGPFVNLGFLPRRAGERAAMLARGGATGWPLVVFEAAPRVAGTLGDLLEMLGDRDAAVCRELTKLHEEIRRGRLAELAALLKEREVRGEVVVVVGAAVANGNQDGGATGEAERIVAEMLGAGAKASVAAREAAAVTGLPRSELYSLARRLTERDGRTPKRGSTEREDGRAAGGG